MFEIPDGYFLSVVLFFVIIGALIYRDRKKVEFNFIVVMRRTKRFRDLIDKVAQFSPGFWRKVGIAAIVICFGAMFFGFYMILAAAHSIITGLITQPALQLILPTPTATGSTGPGYILIPFWFWIITIAAILVPHEVMHGIFARADKIRLKSVGLILLAIFPGAFVEPDEKQLKKAKITTRLRVFAAGSFANFSVAALTIILLGFLIWPAVAGTGAVIRTVAEDSPAALAGLQPDWTMTHVNGEPITTTYWEYWHGAGYFADEVGPISVGDDITFTAEGIDYVVTATEHPEADGMAYIGITYTPIMKIPPRTFFSFASLLTMIWVFSLAVGIFNILPIYPLDGGLMFNAVAEKYFKKRKAMRMTRAVTFFMLLVIIFDFIGPWLMNI